MIPYRDVLEEVLSSRGVGVNPQGSAGEATQPERRVSEQDRGPDGESEKAEARKGAENRSSTEPKPDWSTLILGVSHEMAKQGLGRAPAGQDRPVQWGRVDVSRSIHRICLVKAKPGGGFSIRELSPAEVSKRDLVTIPFVEVRERWYVPLDVNLERGEFLVDSGATTSLVTKDFYDSLSRKPELLASEIGVRTANGTPVKTLGFATFPLGIANRVYMITCIVVSALDGDQGILGMDFIWRHRCNLDWSGILTLENGANSVSCVRQGALGTARLTADVSIDPYKVRFASIGVQPSASKGALLVEPDFSLGEWMMGGLSTYVSATLTDEAVIPLCNPTAIPIKIKKGAPIGVLQPVAGLTDDLDALQHLPGHEPTQVGEGPVTHNTDYVIAPLRKLLEDSEVVDVSTKQTILERLAPFAHVFKHPEETLGFTDKVTHRIDVGNAIPIRQAFRRMAKPQKELAETEVDAMLKKGVIEPSGSPWSSPIVMVRKKDGSIRFCVDYRKLNSVTRKNAYPLPRIDDCLDTLNGSAWYCTLDLESGYWQIAMDPESIEKTAFITASGLYHFKVMPFGLCNAPATFQEMMNKMLRGLIGTKCLVYLDDIIIFGKTLEETIEGLRSVS